MRKTKEKRWAKRGAKVALLCVSSASHDFTEGTVYRAVKKGRCYRSTGNAGSYQFHLPLDGLVWSFRLV